MSFVISVVSGTRADYGLLRELLFRLKNNTLIQLDLIVTGSHLSSLFGNTKSEIIHDGFYDAKEIPIPIGDDTKEGMVKATSYAISAFSDYFVSHRPDLLVVLGDRYEIFAAVIAAHFLGIPIAHISGGDVTEGAIDNSIRHSITKMSQLHFPGCEQSRRRIIQMGEQPNLVFNVGEPGVENCLKLRLINRFELANQIGFSGIKKDYSVVTFHPVTMENNTGRSQLYELIAAMDSKKEMSFLITMANADAGGREINDIWQKQSALHKNWLVVKSLGVVRYLSAIKYSKMVIGNSSSGIVEAPSLGVPTINIGDRQRGRMMADSVISCGPVCKEIESAISLALSRDFQIKAKKVISPFGDGHASELIEKHIISFLESKAVINNSFYDI